MTNVEKKQTDILLGINQIFCIFIEFKNNHFKLSARV